MERVFGVLENYWNGDPLRSVEQALSMASGMTYKGVHPKVEVITRAYPKGICLNKKEMRPYERCLDRLKDLGKWFVTIFADTAQKRIGPPKFRY